MLTLTAAQKIIESRLENQRPQPNDEYIVLAEHTITRDWGWVFFYTSKKWFETRDIQYAIAGNAPLFFLKESGKIVEAGTAHGVEHYIERFEATGDPHG